MKRNQAKSYMVDDKGEELFRLEVKKLSVTVQ